MPRPMQWRSLARRRSPRRRWWPVALALLWPAVGNAAVFAPGAAFEPDPATGDKPAEASMAAQEPLAGGGIQWRFAPWRLGGSLTLDARWQRLEDQRRLTQGVMFGDIDFASYVWQPWFLQLSGGIGLLFSRDVSRGAEESERQRGTGFTGRLGMSLFPASRFPFEFRAELGDSRTSGTALGSDYRSLRLSLAQSYRPASGRDSYRINLDHSRLTTDNGHADTLTAISATSLHPATLHTLELGASFSDNAGNNGQDQSRLAFVSGRLQVHPSSSLQLETRASWSDTRIQASGFQSASEVRQISTLATWRPSEGEPLYLADSPLVLAGSLRWADATSGSGSGRQGASTFNLSLGANLELSRAWRMAASLSAGQFEAAGTRTSNAGANASATWTPLPARFAGWRWTPSAAVTLGYASASRAEARQLVGVQGAHSVSREWAIGEGQGLSMSLAQSAAVLQSSTGAESTRAVAHSASLFWQSSGEGGRSQSFAGLSLSDSRNWSEGDASFQFANLQWTQRLQFSRYSSGSANVTLQATRNQATLVDAFSGELREQREGWRQYYTVSINYEQQRALGIPRLRYSLLLAASSQQLERRALGDIDAPRERVSASFENRLDYSIGRLEARLAARIARVDDRTVAALLARVQRRF